MTTNKKTPPFKVVLVILVFFILGLIIFQYIYTQCRLSFVKDGIKYTRKGFCGQLDSAEILKPIKEKKVTAKVCTATPVNYWEIIDTSKSPNQPTGLKLFEKNLPNTAVSRWKNYLIGVNIENYVTKGSGGTFSQGASESYTLQSQIRTLRIYDVNTGESFDISLDKPIYGEFWYTISQTIDNKFYFGVSGAFGATISYKLDLPPQKGSKISKLESSIGSEIKKYGNIYISSFCYEGCSYSLFDPILAKTTPLKRLTEATNTRNVTRKEEFIGFDNQGRMILNLKNTINNEQQLNTIVAVKPEADETNTTLLKTTDLPETVINYFMVDGLNKILFVGKEKIYIYDLEKNTFKNFPLGKKLLEDITSKKTYDYYSVLRTDTTVCFTDYKKIKYAVNLAEEKYLETPPADCEALLIRKDQNSIFKNLNLPDNFKLIYNSVSYKTFTIQKILQSELSGKNFEIIK